MKVPCIWQLTVYYREGFLFKLGLVLLWCHSKDLCDVFFFVVVENLPYKSETTKTAETKLSGY